MDWSAFTKNISKVVETAQTISERAVEFSQSAMKNLEAMRTASEIIQGKGDIMDKGSKLVALATSSFANSSNANLPYVSNEKSNPNTQQLLVEDRRNQELVQLAEIDNEPSSTYDEVCLQESVTSIGSIATPTDAVTALALMGTELAKLGSEVAKGVQICQVEETKRVEIKARMEVEITKINAISKLLSDYLNKTFDERAALFNSYFNVLDKAMELGDRELMAATLGNINSLAAQSPFKNLADFASVQRQLEQTDTVWDI